MRRVDDLPLEAAFDESIELRPVGLDDYAHVRYIHATSFRLLATRFLEPEALAAASGHFLTPDYNDELLRQELIAAWIGGEMVGTAGWSAVGDDSDAARIGSVFVRPLFTGLGIGRRLVTAAETRAQLRGFKSFAVRTVPAASPFFSVLGYEITSHGAVRFGADSLPLSFMRKSEARRGAKLARADAAQRPAGEPAMARPVPARVCVTRVMADAAAAVSPQPMKFFRH